MAITEKFELREVRVKASQAPDGSTVPGGYKKFGMLHLTRDDGTDVPGYPQSQEIAADVSDADVQALCGKDVPGIVAQMAAMNMTFDELRASTASAQSARDAAAQAQASAESTLATMTAERDDLKTRLETAVAALAAVAAADRSWDTSPRSEVIAVLQAETAPQ